MSLQNHIQGRMVLMTNCLPGEELECQVYGQNGALVWSGIVQASSTGIAQLMLGAPGASSGYRLQVRSLSGGDQAGLPLP